MKADRGPIARGARTSLLGLAVTLACEAPADPAPPSEPEAPHHEPAAVPAAAPPPPATDAPPPGPPPRVGLCPEGMLHVPGGTFTRAQRLRFEQAGRLTGRTYRDDVDDFCLHRAQVTRADVAMCQLKGPCREHARIRRDLEQRASADDQNLFAAASSPEQQNDLELARLAREPYRTDGTTASDICNAMGYALVTTEQLMWAYWGGAEDRRYPWGDSKGPLERLSGEREYHVVDDAAVAPARWGHLGLASDQPESVAAPFAAQYRRRDARGSEPTELCATYDSERFPCGIEAWSDTRVWPQSEFDDGSPPFQYHFTRRVDFRCATTPRPQPAMPRRPLLDTVEFVLNNRPSTHPVARRK